MVTRYPLSGHNKFVIKTIAAKLPEIQYEYFKHRKTNERFRRAFNWLAEQWLTAGICRWYFNKKYTGTKTVNHHRRMCKAFISNGILGVSSYLISVGTDFEIVIKETADLTIDNKQLELQVLKSKKPSDN